MAVKEEAITEDDDQVPLADVDPGYSGKQEGEMVIVKIESSEV